MVTYIKTHPWLKFSADLQKASPQFWIMLGECQSKCEHISGVPLQTSTAQTLYRLYLVKGAQATTAIEGNTLSEEEIHQHLEGKLRLPPSRKYLQQEVDNIIVECNEMLDELHAGTLPPLNPARIKHYNRSVLKNLSVEDGVIPGEIREYPVGMNYANYKGAPAKDCAYLLKKLCEWLNGDEFMPLSHDMHIGYAILKAILAHLYLAWIHPFGDGNGRTARLMEFQILMSSGVPAPAAHLLSNHYNLTRAEYYRQLARASQSGGDVLPFIEYAVRGLLDGLKSQLSEIKIQQWSVAWENFVHDIFKEKTPASATRQLHLILDLSKQAEAVPVSKLPELSPRLAKAYASKTSKTLTRDVNALYKLGLIIRSQKGVIAAQERILAFLPPTAEEQTAN